MRDKLLGTSLAEKYEILKSHFFVMLYLFKEKTHQHDKDMHSGKSKEILFGLYIEFETYETFSLLFQILFRIRNIINKFALTNFY